MTDYRITEEQLTRLLALYYGAGEQRSAHEEEFIDTIHLVREMPIQQGRQPFMTASEQPFPERRGH